MNKKTVERYIPKALEALKDETNLRIAEDGKISKTFRGAVSSFGAAITMGSFKAAVAFFSDNASSSINRNELLKAMYHITKNEWKDPKVIFDEVSGLKGEQLDEMKEDFINASIALKLAMNAFTLVQ